MRSLALLVLPACFYTAPFNERPALDIRQEPTADGTLRRGDELVLTAVVRDAEAHVVFLSWAAYACDDETSCDDTPYATASTLEFRAVVPPLHAGDTRPTRHVHVVLEGEDQLGAIARPAQELVLPVANARPTLRLAARSAYGGLIGTPLDVFADYGDADDGPDHLAIAWSVFAPGTSTAALVPIDDVAQPADPARRRAGMRLVPDEPGGWMIAAIVTDPLDETARVVDVALVVPDGPPCLDTLEPAVPPDDAVQALPFTAPALFRAAVVTDELDRLPRDPSDPLLGDPGFHWSLRRGDGERTELAASGNALALDPAQFALGELLELRLEVDDRNHTPLPCADAAPSCSIGASACVQRRTWRLEVR